MDADEILQELQDLGTEQNRKIYRRHGVQGPQYGVSYADLDRLTKKMKVNHELALRLWESENHDARILATRIVDPARLNGDLLDAWASALDNYVVTDAFAAMAVKAALAVERLEAWIQADGEWVGRTGWLMVAQLAMQDGALAEGDCKRYLETIEREIHNRKNRVRDAMNSALIAIGLRNEHLRELALDAAGRIGKVKVDHGETNCKTPDAAPYIQKAWQRKTARQKA